MKIALHNPHKLANLTNYRIHNYVVDMIKMGYIDYLFFDDPSFFKELKSNLYLLNNIRKQYGWKDLGLNKVKFIFSSRSLNKKCDVLLNFNGTPKEDFTAAVKDFPGIKAFHLMDYFWREPGSEKYKRLKEYGVDYLMGYASHDKYCTYFEEYFPDYIGKVIAVPFGFAERFKSTVPFEDRKNKCVAVGSVNPFRPPDAAPINYIETADFFQGEEWLHKFRRQIVENMPTLGNEIDSMLPVFPKYKDHKYDIVAKLNEYKMFVSDETMFYFPTAKTFEGPACGTVMVCSDHPCFAEYGFIDGINCITHKQMDIADMKAKITEYQNNPEKLAQIQQNATKFVLENYSHQAIAKRLYEEVKKLKK
ncbi:MAG: glycosyltransferase [Patescibacteria group bacterium]